MGCNLPIKKVSDVGTSGIKFRSPMDIPNMLSCYNKDVFMILLPRIIHRRFISDQEKPHLQSLAVIKYIMQEMPGSACGNSVK